MFNVTETLISAFSEELRKGYRRMYGGLHRDYEEIICWISSVALDNISNSDSLYHDVEHTILITLVGQEIFRGVHARDGGVTPRDWLNLIISLLCHDIGYVKGICRTDDIEKNLFSTGINGELIKLPYGASDASLTDHHVNRGKQFIQERFKNHDLIDTDLISKNIELTRFPVPKENDLKDDEGFPSLIRAADLIGQLSDPRYLYKINALFYEFEETGMNHELGYKNPDDLRLDYPTFYWKTVLPYVKRALQYLSISQYGQQIISNLYANVFVVQHNILTLGSDGKHGGTTQGSNKQASKK